MIDLGVATSIGTWLVTLNEKAQVLRSDGAVWSLETAQWSTPVTAFPDGVNAYGINDLGDIVGITTDNNPPPDSYYPSVSLAILNNATLPARVVYPSVPPGGDSLIDRTSAAAAVNNSGTVAGSAVKELQNGTFFAGQIPAIHQGTAWTFIEPATGACTGGDLTHINEGGGLLGSWIILDDGYSSTSYFFRSSAGIDHITEDLEPVDLTNNDTVLYRDSDNAGYIYTAPHSIELQPLLAHLDEWFPFWVKKMNDRLEILDESGTILFRNFLPVNLAEAASIDPETYNPSSLSGIDINNKGVILAEINTAGGSPARHAVLLVPVSISYEAVDGNITIADNVNPATEEPMPGGGKRIFPDALRSADQTLRNLAHVKIEAAIPDIQIYAKAFDVDDPTSDDIIDPNEGSGDDNRTEAETLIGVPTVPRPPVFFSTGTASITLTTNEDGEAVMPNGVPAVLQVGWQPGDNYRVAVAFNPLDLSPLQVAAPDDSGYLPSGDIQPEEFKGVASEMLTVWRKLNIEVDTMLPWQGTKPEPDRTTAVGVSWTPTGSRWMTLTLTGDLPQTEDNFYAGGFISVGSIKYNIEQNTASTIRITNPGGTTQPPSAELNQFIGQMFEVRDDDDRAEDFQLLNLLPQSNLISNEMKEYFSVAYIFIEEVPHSSEYNARPTLPFELNTLYNPTTLLDDSQDMNGADRKEYWYNLLSIAYQPKETDDGDPPQTTTSGISLNVGIGVPYLNSVYVEPIREMAVAGTGIGSSQQTAFEIDLSEVIAHEIGHSCGGPYDHDEGGIMEDGGGDIEFSPLTIKRFRSTEKWIQFTGYIHP